MKAIISSGTGKMGFYIDSIAGDPRCSHSAYYEHIMRYFIDLGWSISNEDAKWILLIKIRFELYAKGGLTCGLLG